MELLAEDGWDEGLDSVCSCWYSQVVVWYLDQCAVLVCVYGLKRRVTIFPSTDPPGGVLTAPA